jgi:heat shock protein HtpX
MEKITQWLSSRITVVKKSGVRGYIILGIWLATIVCLIYSLVKFPEGLLPLIFVPVVIIAILAIFVLFGTLIIESKTRVRYLRPEENPELDAMVAKLANQAGIPKPRIGICPINVPNAFTFGGTQKGARLCVTTRLLELLQSDELEAVLGHEIAHIKQRDIAFMSVFSFPPIACYYVGMGIFFFSLAIAFAPSEKGEGGLFKLVIIPFAIGIWLYTWIVYIAGMMIELAISRHRENMADKLSSELTGKPEQLASALIKITEAAALLRPSEIRQIGAIRAFMATDPSSASEDLKILDKSEFTNRLRKNIFGSQPNVIKEKQSLFDSFSEMFSTHPSVIGRIKTLEKLKYQIPDVNSSVRKQVSLTWWILPVALLWLGGIVAWLTIKKDQPDTAKVMLTVGVFLTAFFYLLATF